MERTTAVILTVLTLAWVILTTQGILIPRASHMHGLQGREHRGKTICNLGVNAGAFATIALAVQATLLISGEGEEYIRWSGVTLSAVAFCAALAMNRHLFYWILPAIILELLIVLS